MCDAPGQRLNSAAEFIIFFFKNWATAESNQLGSPWGKNNAKRDKSRPQLYMRIINTNQ